MKENLVRLLTNTSKVMINENLEVKIADELSEYSKAFTLLHDAYVAKGLMENHISGFRCNIHSFLPHNTVIVVKDLTNNTVVGTVSLILDSVLGLPAEKAYPEEVEQIRKIKKNKLVEVSALAVDPKYRNQAHAIQFMLNKFLYHYCKNNLGVDMLLIVIHPKAELFYKSLMGFQPLGKIIHYDFVKGALARFLYLDFSGDFEKSLQQKYIKIHNSFFEYVVFKEDKRLKINFNNREIVFRNKKDMLKLMELAHYSISELSPLEKNLLLTGLGETREMVYERKEINYRYEVKIPVKVRIENAFFESELLNISSDGAFVKCTNVFWRNGSVGELNFELNGQMYFCNFEIRWFNNGVASKIAQGFGVQFKSSKIDFFKAKIA